MTTPMTIPHRFVRTWREAVGGSQGAQRITDNYNVDWIIKPAVRPSSGLKSTITEYVGARLAMEMHLPVPDHELLYLPARTIAAHPELQHFTQGMVLGSKYTDGLDLALVEKRLMLSTVVGGALGSLYNHNRFNAVGIMIADTWLANGDRGLGILGDHYRQQGYESNNNGNLFFERVKNTKNEYVIKAIDFGHAFWGSTWGFGLSNEDWPDIVLGAMRFFFKTRMLTGDYNNHSNDCNTWIGDVHRIDVQSTVSGIVSELPDYWLNGSLGSSQTFSSPDWDDLINRLESRKNSLNSILINGYQAVAVRYGAR